MLGHQAAAFGERQREPVLPHLPFLVHRIEAGIGPRREFGLKPRLSHVVFAGGVALHLRLPRRTVAGLPLHDEPLAELLDRRNVFAHLRETHERIGRLDRLSERSGQQPLMHVVHLQRRRIHGHHPEVGLVAGHEPGLQSERGQRAGRIERLAEEPRALGTRLRREGRQTGPIKPVEEMADMPALRRRRRHLAAGLLAGMGGGGPSGTSCRSMGGGGLHRLASLRERGAASPAEGHGEMAVDRGRSVRCPGPRAQRFRRQYTGGGLCVFRVHSIR